MPQLEIFAVLYCDAMRLSADPIWSDRDRFMMGKGHAAVGLYPLLADLGDFGAEVPDGHARQVSAARSSRRAPVLQLQC